PDRRLRVDVRARIERPGGAEICRVLRVLGTTIADVALAGSFAERTLVEADQVFELDQRVIESEIRPRRQPRERVVTSVERLREAIGVLVPLLREDVAHRIAAISVQRDAVRA